MKLSIIILGVFIAAGLLGGAYIMALSKTDSKEYETGLKLAEDRISELEKKMMQFMDISEQLAQEFESNRLIIQANSEKMGEISQQHPAAAQPAVSPTLPVGKTEEPAASQPSPMPEAIETIKEEVKKELKEERLAQAREKFQNWYREMSKAKPARFKKKMEENFPRLVQRAGLSPTQEYAIREAAESAFKKKMELLENFMADKPRDEIDWGALQEQLKGIEKEFHTQVDELVGEEQAEGVTKFFEGLSSIR